MQVDKKGVLDLLLVVDNSASMQKEQENLSGKLGALLSSIDELDWQIGVISTDNNKNCEMSLIRSSDANKDALFKKAVSLGTNGSGAEQGIRRAVVGLKCVTSPWLRLILA